MKKYLLNLTFILSTFFNFNISAEEYAQAEQDGGYVIPYTIVDGKFFFYERSWGHFNDPLDTSQLQINLKKNQSYEEKASLLQAALAGLAALPAFKQYSAFSNDLEFTLEDYGSVLSAEQKKGFYTGKSFYLVPIATPISYELPHAPKWKPHITMDQYFPGKHHAKSVTVKIADPTELLDLYIKTYGDKYHYYKKFDL